MKTKQRHQLGSALLEYALILSLTVGACIAATQVLGLNVSTMMNNMSQQIVAAMNAVVP